MRSIFVCAALLVLSGSAIGATRYVQGIGKPNHLTIQEAIDAADNGDEIRVAPGTYHETINFNGKAVRLYSAGATRTTIIDGTGLSRPVVTCNHGETSATVLDGFTITGGSAGNGGGMYNDQSSPTVTGCTFQRNSASGIGGGMYNRFSSPTVTNCTFSGNSAADDGGGMYNIVSGTVVSNCTFSNNTGGAVSNGPVGGLTATNCIFSGNTGAGIFNFQDGTSTAINCLFSDNSGPGVANGSYSNATVINCTFSGNAGGGINAVAPSGTGVANCILWSDPGGEILAPAGTFLIVTYSDIQGGFAGTGNINADPLFVNAAHGDFHLRPGSPCIDAGDNAAVPAGVTTDLDGDRRIQGDAVDMGAHESESRRPR